MHPNVSARALEQVPPVEDVATLIDRVIAEACDNGHAVREVLELGRHYQARLGAAVGFRRTFPPALMLHAAWETRVGP